MKLTDELKILDDKIKVNQAQYASRREAAKISALPSKNILDKYVYLTGEDLGYEKNIWSIIHSIVLQSLKTSINLKNCHMILCTKF